MSKSRTKKATSRTTCWIARMSEEPPNDRYGYSLHETEDDARTGGIMDEITSFTKLDFERLTGFSLRPGEIVEAELLVKVVRKRGDK